MSWTVEPAAWLKEPAVEPGDTYPADALDRQVVAATESMPEGPRFPESSDLTAAPKAVASAAPGIPREVDDEPSEVVDPGPEPGAPAAGTFSDTLDIHLEPNPDGPLPPPPTPDVDPEDSAPRLEVSLHRVAEEGTEAAASEAEVATQAAPTQASAAGSEAPPEAAPEADAPGPTPSDPAEPPVGLFIPVLTNPEPPPDPVEVGAPAEVLANPGAPQPVVKSSTEELIVDDDEFEEVEEVDELDEVHEAVEDVPDAPTQSPPQRAEAAPPKPPERKRRHWADDVFKEHYLATLPPDADRSAEADVAFLEASLELEAPARILDIGCGNGRHAFAFADRGHEVVGLDASLDMLLAAGRRNEGREHPVNFLRADMRKLPGDAKYDVVCCLGSSFGYYEDEVNRKILQGFRDALAPGGRLVLQVFNRDYMAPRVPCRSWWQGPRCMVLDEVEMNYFANRLRVHRTIVFDDGRQFDHYLFLKAFTLHEIGKTLSSLGMRVREVSGSRDTRGRFYGAEAPDIWVVAELKGDG